MEIKDTMELAQMRIEGTRLTPEQVQRIQQGGDWHYDLFGTTEEESHARYLEAKDADMHKVLDAIRVLQEHAVSIEQMNGWYKMVANVGVESSTFRFGLCNEAYPARKLNEPNEN